MRQLPHWRLECSANKREGPDLADGVEKLFVVLGHHTQ